MASVCRSTPDVEVQLSAMWGNICHAVDRHLTEVECSTPRDGDDGETWPAPWDSVIFSFDSLRPTPEPAFTLRAAEVDKDTVLDAWRTGCSKGGVPSSPRSGASSHSTTSGSGVTAGSVASAGVDLSRSGRPSARPVMPPLHLDETHAAATEAVMITTPRVSPGELSARRDHPGVFDETSARGERNTEGYVVKPRSSSGSIPADGGSQSSARGSSPTRTERPPSAKASDAAEAWRKVAYLDKTLPPKMAACACLLCKPSAQVFMVSKAKRSLAMFRQHPAALVEHSISACVLGQCPRNEDVQSDADASFTTAIILLQPPFQEAAATIDKLGVHFELKKARHDLGEDPDSYLVPERQPSLVTFPLESVEAFMAATEPMIAGEEGAKDAGGDDVDLFAGVGCKSPHVVYIHVREPAPSPVAGLRPGRKREEPRRRFLLTLSLPTQSKCVEICRILEAHVARRQGQMVVSVPEAIQAAQIAVARHPAVQAMGAVEGSDILGLRLSELGEPFWYVSARQMVVKASRGVGTVLTSVAPQLFPSAEDNEGEASFQPRPSFSCPPQPHARLGVAEATIDPDEDWLAS
mmetsp:Transcript_79855/g.213468  ORF Transcript_79855/g.213468 Transcript_79855/m.213468 type:complete len:580 (+) Transcript_79855:71-1810(+)